MTYILLHTARAAILHSMPRMLIANELESRAVATLNHSNIVAIYDVSRGCIVNELVDGEPSGGRETRPT
jgi:hypothetical protein